MTVDQFLAGLNVWARRWSWPMAGCMTFLPNLENAMQTNGYLVKFVAILTLAACFSFGGKVYHEIAHVFNAAVVAMQSPLQSQQSTVAASTDNGQ